MSDASLRARLTAEGLEPGSWSNGPHDRYGSHEHGYDKVIVVAAGSIRFGLDAGSVDLVQGDRLELLARTAHDAVVGPDGVTCLEVHLPHGSLNATSRWVVDFRASMTVLPVTAMERGAIPSASRLAFDVAVGAKWSAAMGAVSRRLTSSGNGE